MKKVLVNPFLPKDEYIPDGEPHVFGDRVYLFGSHDEFDGAFYCVNDYVGWSAPLDDLSDWRYEGVIYKKTQDPRNTDGRRNMFAPDVAQGPDGRYYLYYTLDLKGETGIMSVAVCDTPVGQYEYYGDVQFADGSAWGSKAGELLNYDPGIFVDDDQRIYLYTGIAVPNISGLKKVIEQKERVADGCYVVELEPDMKTIKGDIVKLLDGKDDCDHTEYEGHAFFEASSLRKINGTYYLVYCSQLSHELCYATSSSPFGPFSYGGILVSIANIGYNGKRASDADNYYGNTHGSIVELNGQWYVFYHRHTNLHQFSRQACAEPIFIQEDGSIQQVPTSSTGLLGHAFQNKTTYEARIASVLKGKNGGFAYTVMKAENEQDPYYTQETQDEEAVAFIANMTNGSIAGFTNFAIPDVSQVSVRVRGTATGSLVISTSQRVEDQIGVVELSACEGWSEYKATLQSPTQEEYPLYFIYTGEGAFDLLEFTLA